ncbi:hypothetical protein [Rhizorhabdus argentea]|uniref:hypothetical protein n=1 Tax=Rhizorhabdus argentea TaxID=1387174 RepID=UPI0030EE9B91
MAVSASEAFLHSLAERTFLKLWSVPNAYRAPGKEISDLIIVFGDDIVIFSDKACEFSTEPDLQTGWDRWRRVAIDGSVRQLAGALRRLSEDAAAIFVDAKGRTSLPFPLPPSERRRFHLVAIARPSHDPEATPLGWRALTCVAEPTGRPFEVEQLAVGDLPVHVFDGVTMDILLEHLDTAPDFIAYLDGRARQLAGGGAYSLEDLDLLAGSIRNWGSGSGLSPEVPPFASVARGYWPRYVGSDGAIRSASLNKRSRTIDRLIEHFHQAYEAGSFLRNKPPEILAHEQALRLIAAESRFARRMIVTPLYDILSEEDQSVPWTATVPSPRDPTIRYLWLIYPDPPEGTDPDEFARLVDAQLQHQTLVIAGEFKPDRVIAIAVPNGAASENVVIMRVFDSSRWSDEDRRQAMLLKDERLFGESVRTDHLHIP